MIALFSATIISCAQADTIINNVNKVVRLSDEQKMEIISQLRESTPSCPIIIQENKNAKPIKKARSTKLNYEMVNVEKCIKTC